MELVALAIGAAGLWGALPLSAQDDAREPVAASRPEDDSDAEPVQAETPAAPDQAADATTAEPATAPPDISDRGQLEAFFDGVLLTQLESKHIAGATLAVVADGKIIFSKGYGYADYAERKPVDPETTMFRIGSVSKLFTWTAVMQLVEEGKLDLNTDINTYLEGSEVKIPATYDQPITLKHLLTHTPGFEDSVIGLFGNAVEDVRPLEKVLHDQLPRRVRKPGELASYSNHGTALAGYIVSRVSGIPWDDYIEQKILQPLGMSHTTVRQPAESELPAEMSQGYKYKNGTFQKEKFEYVPPAPAGSMSASAVDMARFILANLQAGALGSARILKPETAHQMRERLFTHDERLDAMCYGLWETNRNHQRILHHGGDTILFHSLLAFLPERGVGFFVSYNTNTAGTARSELLSAFLDRYYPLPESLRLKAPEGFQARAGRYVGTYKLIRHDYSTLAKLGALMGVVEVKKAEDGTLIIGSEIAGGSRHYAEVDKLMFQEVDGEERIAFREDDRGRITHMFLGALPAIALEKLPWYETPNVHLGLLIGSAVVFVSALIGWPFVALVTQNQLIAGRRPTAMSHLASWLGWVACAVYLVFLVGFSYFMLEPEKLAFGMPRELDLLLLVPQACVVFAAIVLLCALLSWLRGYWRLTGRVHYLLVALAGVGFVWFLYHWNLLKLGA